jgi:hypothetical protein
MNVIHSFLLHISFSESGIHYNRKGLKKNKKFMRKKEEFFQFLKKDWKSIDRLLNLPATKVVGFLRTKGFLIHLRAELALVPQDFHGQTP